MGIVVKSPVIARYSGSWEIYSLKRGMMMGKVVSKIWVKYVINFFVDQHKLPEILEVYTLGLLCLLCKHGKLNYDENTYLPAQFTNVVHSDGNMVEDTEEDL